MFANATIYLTIEYFTYFRASINRTKNLTMKYLLALTCILFSVNLLSQEFKKVSYQVNAGTTLSIPDASPVFEGFEDAQRNYSNAFGYFVNFLVSYNFTDSYGLSTGLNFNSINTKIDDEFGGATYDTNWHIRYLNIPLMFDYNLSEHFTLSGGAYGGILISAKEKGTVSSDGSELILDDVYDPAFKESFKASIDEDIKDMFKNYDLGLSAKVAYGIQLSPKYKGVISTQFNYGLLNAFYATESVRSDWKWRNVNLMIGFGIQF